MKPLPEAKHLEPLRVKKDTVILRMREIMAGEAFPILAGLQGIEREQLIQDAIKKKSADACAKLEGYELAANMIQRWASKDLSEEKDDLQNPLEEGE